jgi:2-succinyl-6-hydroxy-2,4-cyclohexadiene-1-carboxylate synthase
MVESVVLLHGFSGTSRAWDRVVECLDPESYRPLRFDLPGHGQAVGSEPQITFDGCVASVLERSPKRFVLTGYSMGGRIALHVALMAPERIERLVLIGVNPGIEDDRERARRRDADRRLADELESSPFESFIERWRSQPLFAGEPSDVSELARADQRRNRPAALAAVLRGIGTGEMQPLWDRLVELTMPVTVVVGDRDVGFHACAHRMVKLLPRAELRILPGGHGLPLENPAGVADVLAAATAPVPAQSRRAR